MVKGGRLIFAELKSSRGHAAIEQRAWLDDLGWAGAETYIWFPLDWLRGDVERALKAW